MGWQVTVYTPIQIITALISCGLAVYAWHRRRVVGTAWFAGLQSLIGLWIFFNMLELGATTLETKLFFSNVQYLSIVLLPVVWLAFVSTYTGHNHWLRPRVLALLLIVPLLTLVMVWANPWSLFRISVALSPGLPVSTLRTERGPWFWFPHTAYAYSLVIAASALLIYAVLRSPALYQGQGLVLLAAALVPMTANAFYIFGLLPRPVVDTTPFAFLITSLLLSLDIFRFRLLDIMPVALNHAIATMSDAMVVLDARHRVLQLNEAARRLLPGACDRAVGCAIEELWVDFSHALTPHLGDTDTRVDIRLPGAEQTRHYDVLTSPLSDRRQHLMGWVVVLRDVSDQKLAEATLRMQKRVLEDLVTVARAMAEGPALDETLRNTIEVTIAITGAASGHILLVDAAGALAQFIGARGNEPLAVDWTRAQMLAREGVESWVIRERRPALIADLLTDTRWQYSDAPQATRAALCVPILSGATPLGTITLNHPEPGYFSQEHITVLQLAVDQIALAVRNARLYEEQRRLAYQQSTLYEVLRQVGGHLDPEAVVEVAVSTVADLTHWPTVQLWFPEAEAEAEEDVDAIVARAFHANATQTREVRDAPAPSGDAVIAPRTRRQLAVPLRRGTEVLGVLSIESVQRDPFAGDDVALAESLAEAIALALANARFHGEMRRYAEAIAEERGRLEAIIRASRDGIILVGMDRRVLVLNTRALQLLGVQGDVEMWLGLPLRAALRQLQAYAPEIVKVTWRELRRVTTGQEPPGEGILEVPPRIIHWLNLPVLVGETALGRLLVFRDVTEERQLSRIRDELTHTMVHDLRSPLGIISGALDLLHLHAREMLDADHGTAIDIARRSTRRMMRLVDAILEISRLESQKIPLELTSFALAPLVETIVQEFAPLAQEKHLTLETTLPHTLPPVWADAELIERVLHNLLSNAVKFTPAGGAIHITVGHTKSQPDQLRVSVSDTGRGIPQELERRLFQKFARGNLDGRGSGLGLAFCQMALKAHGEQIWLDQEAAPGATFVFTLSTTDAKKRAHELQTHQ